MRLSRQTDHALDETIRVIERIPEHDHISALYRLEARQIVDENAFLVGEQRAMLVPSTFTGLVQEDDDHQCETMAINRSRVRREFRSQECSGADRSAAHLNLTAHVSHLPPLGSGPTEDDPELGSPVKSRSQAVLVRSFHFWLLVFIARPSRRAARCVLSQWPAECRLLGLPSLVKTSQTPLRCSPMLDIYRKA